MATKIEIKGPIVTNTAGEFYQWLGWEAAYPKLLQQELNKANGGDVIIEVNSNGGVATSGFEMYKIIKDYPGRVTVHLINAMSAASLVVCAGDEVLTSDAAILMIHNTRCYTEGDYRDMHMSGDALEAFNQGIINVYVRRTGKSRDELQSLMDNDTFMSPEMAIEYGFVDGYLYGNPAENRKEKVVVNATIPIITEEKAREILAAMKDGCFSGLPEPDGGEDERPPENNQTDVSPDETVSDKKNQKGGNKDMTLEEFLQENPEEEGKLNQMLRDAKNDGVKEERTRLQDLDELYMTVKRETLQEAKYGETVIDAKELAFKAMKDEKLRMTSYMADAMADFKESKTEEVKASPEENEKDESDTMAGYVNKRKGGVRNETDE